jgi:trans-aconitate 2-methyltransferase
MQRSWDAHTYHHVSGLMDSFSVEVLDRLILEGNETVLDAGCGTGRITALLLERLPRGRVIAVDADEAMAAQARRNLDDERVFVKRTDLLALDLDQDVDAVFSTATLHWVLDHDRLFANLFSALRPGGQLVAQFGGEGNINSLLRAAHTTAADPEYAQWLENFVTDWYFPRLDETRRRLERVGFEQTRCWRQSFRVEPDDPITYLETIPLGSWVQLLPEDRRRRFTEAVADRLGKPLIVEYVRLNVDATRPALS